MSELYKGEHERRYSISTSNHVLLCLLYKLTDNNVFNDFPEISDHSPKIVWRLHCKHFWTISKKFAKITKDCSRLSRKIWKCFDHTKKLSIVGSNFRGWNVPVLFACSVTSDRQNIFTCLHQHPTWTILF